MYTSLPDKLWLQNMGSDQDPKGNTRQMSKGNGKKHVRLKKKGQSQKCRTPKNNQIDRYIGENRPAEIEADRTRDAVYQSKVEPGSDGMVSKGWQAKSWQTTYWMGRRN